jgi:hypothetical protein
LCKHRSRIVERYDHMAVTGQSTHPSFAQNAGPCSVSHAFVQYPTLADADIRSSPASLLHTGDVASQSVQTELELYTTVSTHTTGSHDHTTTHSGHAEVPQHTSSLCAHGTAVLDLCRTGVAVHLAELELGLRARTLGQGGVANNIAKSLSV